MFVAMVLGPYDEANAGSGLGVTARRDEHDLSRVVASRHNKS